MVKLHDTHLGTYVHEMKIHGHKEQMFFYT